MSANSIECAGLIKNRNFDSDYESVIYIHVLVCNSHRSGCPDVNVEFTFLFDIAKLFLTLLIGYKVTRCDTPKNFIAYRAFHGDRIEPPPSPKENVRRRIGEKKEFIRSLERIRTRESPMDARS